MPPTRTTKSYEGKKAADAAVYGVKPGFKHEGRLSAVPGMSDETTVSRFATGSYAQVPHSFTQSSVKAESPISVKSEPQSDQEMSRPQSVQNAAAAVHFDADDFSDDEDLSFNEAPPAPKQTRKPKTARAPRPTGPKGSTSVCFQYDFEWEKHRVEWLGHATRAVTFKDKLTPAHIDTLLSFTETCERLTSFSFVYHDVDYDATNSAEELTDDDIIKIARACPKLKGFYLPGASGLTEKAFLALCEHCPDLSTLQISKASRGPGNTGHDIVFEALRNHPEWVPKLKELRIAKMSWTSKVLRELSKARPKLHIILISTSEVKKWGDWQLETYQSEWWRGKCQDRDGVAKRNQRRWEKYDGYGFY
ncbi:hypothetical protein BDP81DRAFT_395966 [Colletotrichum phormii]|uniref:Uncharacterized protein n=1 Tax=Colletotrichum phormii TaxID=359342 RepID=A0AAJ0EF75_9PEZI|nr:uncharacterized protein BDP81DRAFT_395966 [Colletotrichum phormii]KAK1634690.1 hypothetical protein BDP81DRAFT_395966 [Colletotrichum phormii]